MISKWLLADKEKAYRNGTIWNTIASAEYSLQSAVLLLVVTRLGGLTQAGIFTITYTVAQMMATIGSYGMRDYQSSDVRRDYRFTAYWTSRMITIVIMLLVCMGYAFWEGYAKQEIILIAIWALYRVVDDIEDVLHGEMQRSFRLDIAAKIMAARILTATVVFIIVYAETLNLLISASAFSVTAVLVEWWLSYKVIDLFEDIQLRLEGKGVGTLLLTCFPLCVGGFLYNYLVNASKYAINRNMQEEFQTLFSILFMPIFAINMISVFIYKPMVADMGRTWAQQKHKIFFIKMLKLIAAIAGLTVMIALGGYVIGLDLLELIYGVDLETYRVLFAILLLFGGIAAIDAFLVTTLTIMRKQKLIVVAYTVAALLNLLIADWLLQNYQLWGAGMVYGVTMSVVLLMLLAFVLLYIRKRTE